MAYMPKKVPNTRRIINNDISKCIKLFITSVEKVIEFKFKNIKIMVYSYVKPFVEKTIS